MNLNVNNFDLAERIKQSRNELKLTRPEACKLLNISVSTLQAWENGDREPSSSQAVTLADTFNVSLIWLLTGNNHKQDTEKTIDHSEFSFIPKYEISASAGHGSWHDQRENQRFTMAFRTYWIENYIHANPKNLSVITVKGDSMEGVLNDRDVILINHADKDPKEGIYVLRVDGHLIVKRV